jgi:putative transposase
MASRPLDPVYPVIFVDALVVKVRAGQVRNTPFYVVMGVTTAGERDILGIWAGGDGGEGARFWLTELKNRGVEDVLIAVCDGLKGLPEAITTTWEHTIVQQCIVHLIRASFRYAGRQHRDAIVKGLKPVYTAPSGAAAKDRFAEFAAEWGQRYPAILRLWQTSWAEFVPFLEYTTWRCAESSAARTPLSRSTPATAARSRPEGTSPTRRPRSSVYTWSPGPLTPLAAGRHAGPSGGNPL